MNYLIIGNIASGKSKLGEEISARTNCEVFSIDDMRKEYSDGTFAGEFKAWAEMLEVIQHPQPDGNGVYEFSGTGKNAWFVREAIKYSRAEHNSDWRIVYCLCDKAVLVSRCEGRVYDVPLPYDFGDRRPEDTIDYMSGELQKKYGKNYFTFPEITVRTDNLSVTDCVDAIMSA